MQERTSVQITAVLLLAIFWSVNWPMMKIGLEVVEPWTFRGFLVFAGAIGCLSLAAFAGERLRIARRDLAPVIAVGLLQGVMWNAFSGFGISLIEAGRASVLAFTMPVWATMLSVLILGERLTAGRIAGLSLGMTGMAFLLVPALDAMSAEAAGSLLMIGAAMSWAAATIVVKKHDWVMSPLVLAGWQFVIGAIPLSLASMVFGDPATLLNVDLRTGSAIAYSALFPMVFCQAVFFTLVRRLPASIASMSTLLIPPLGVFFSALILGEAVGLAELAAMVLVVLALVCVLPGFDWRAAAARRAQQPD